MKITDLKDYTVLAGSSPVVEKKQVAQDKSLGQKVLDAGTSVSNFFGGKGIADLVGAGIASVTAKPNDKKFVEYPKAKEVVGSALQLGSNFFPAVGVGGKLLTKVAVGAGTGLAMDIGSKLQDKNLPTSQTFTPGIGTVVGGTLPVVGVALKPVTAIVGRLFKGLGSGLSGASTKAIDEIINNPQKAMEISKQIAQKGEDKILENNAKTIINGVSQIRQEARKAYGIGLEQLSATDINPPVFRENVQATLDKYGIYQKNGQRLFSNVEFNDPRNIQKASELVDKLHNAQLDGKSLRKLSDDIENASYKIATSDERLSFNAFLNDLSSGIKNAVNTSTDKLQEINKKFSTDIQLTEAVQNIFGKVNYKNLSEVVKASQKLESLFAQKGLAPEVTDNFLKRIGINPSDFKTSEAVRQISSKQSGSNAKGLSIGEVTQQVTSSILTPNMVKNLSITIGLSKEKLIPLLRQMKTPARNLLIQTLLQASQSDSKQ